MRTPGPLAALLASALVCSLLTLGACGKTSRPRSAFAPTGIIGLTATFPATGSSNVEPDTEIRLVLVAATETLAPGTVVIEAGGTRLSGTFEGVSPSRVWTFVPDQELPRGATIDIRVATGVGLQTAATFTVREAGPAQTFDLPGVSATGVRSWSSGRRAVVSAGTTYEVTESGVEPRAVVIPPIAWTFGDDDFAFPAPSFPLDPTELVRRDLDGNEQRIPLPFPRPIAAHNDRGDAVIFVTSDLGTPNDWGPWRLRAGETQWQWLGSLVRDDAPDVAIDRDGNVACAFFADAQLHLHRFVDGNLVPEMYEVPGTDYATETRLDLAEDGTGAFAWHDGEFHLMQFSPALGLQEVSLPTAQPLTYLVLPGSTQLRLHDVVATSNGNAILFTGFVQTSFEFYQRGVLMQRIDASNPGGKRETSDATRAYNDPGRVSKVARKSGEVWALVRPNFGEAGFEILRSRPGERFAPLRSFYPETLPGNSIDTVEWTFDDSGRALFAINELGAQTCRIIIWQ